MAAAVLLAALLGATMALVSVEPTAAGEAKRTAVPAPSPAATVTPDPPATLEPAPTPGPAATHDPTPAPEPTLPAPGTLPPPVPTDAPSDAPVATIDPNVDPNATEGPAASAPTEQLDTTVGAIHAWIDTLNSRGQLILTGELDALRAELYPYDLYRVWFQVVNGTDLGLEIGPVLEVAAGLGGTEFVTVPAPELAEGSLFYVTAHDGVRDATRAEIVGVDQLRLPSGLDERASAVDGLLSVGTNPAGRVALPPHSFTEVGFTIRLSGGARGAGFTFRLTDGGVALSAEATALARLTMDAPLLTPIYRSAAPGVGPRAALTAVSPHSSYTLTTDACAACHSSHRAERPFLGATAGLVSSGCFRCHDGTGANANILAEYDDPAVPPNGTPNASSWYSHPATASVGHGTDREDEFSGRLDRHADCADCHQPHNADSTTGTETASGWTASGAIKGASSVAVTNGPPRTYTWQSSTTLEYQLCFKCHSGFTTLASGARDKAAEFDPSNASYHPIEQAGTNSTAAMTWSLSGGVVWRFTTAQTVRCTNCHGNYRTVTDGQLPGQAAVEAPHTSKYEGILIANYLRTPRSAGQGYTPNTTDVSLDDFGLCFLCHDPSAFTGNSDSAFRHASHVGGHTNAGSAICAECHYQTHSSWDRPTTQTGDASRLVVFGPGVTANGGVLEWIAATNQPGSCTLTCHGSSHNGRKY